MPLSMYYFKIDGEDEGGGASAVDCSGSTNANNFVTGVASNANGNITMTGEFPDFASISGIMLTLAGGTPLFYPADPEVQTLDATTISITAASLEGETASAVELQGLDGTAICTFTPGLLIDGP